MADSAIQSEPSAETVKTPSLLSNPSSSHADSEDKQGTGSSKGKLGRTSAGGGTPRAGSGRTKAQPFADKSKSGHAAPQQINFADGSHQESLGVRDPNSQVNLKFLMSYYYFFAFRSYQSY